MKLKIEKFEKFAKCHGYQDGTELIEDFGCRKSTYNYFKRGGKIGSDLVVEIYNRFGADTAFQIIDFEEETVSGLESKFIKIGNKLY